MLQFDMQVKTFFNDINLMYSNRCHSGFHILCENKALFREWLNLERQLSQKKVDLMFNSFDNGEIMNLVEKSEKSNDNPKSGSILSNLNQKNEIWSCIYSDIDEMKPPRCAESFILILKSIKERYSNLPYPSKKIEFTNLQLELLNDFHLRLCQIIRDEAKAPFSKNYLGVLNTINYIIYVLDEWKNTAVNNFFLILMF